MTAIVLYVAQTPTGVKVQYRDYSGLAEGLFSKGYTRYFYGEDALGDALSYAERKAEQMGGYEVQTTRAIDRGRDVGVADD
jgi:hypothetical protein